MPRPEKVQAVEEIKDRLESSEATFLAEYRGLSVKQQQALRRGLRDAGAEFKVVKMSLARRAADELGIDFGSDLAGPTALAFANGDPVPVAKALRDFGKENDAFVLKSGLFGGNVLPPEQVTKLADIEPREVLLGKIAGAAKAPLYSLAGMLSSFNRNAAAVFSQLLEKKESEAPAPVADEAAAAPVAEAEAAEPVDAEAEPVPDDAGDEPVAAEPEPVADDAGDEPAVAEAADATAGEAASDESDIEPASDPESETPQEQQEAEARDGADVADAAEATEDADATEEE
jgi:large subunit ribosomal protein L10